MTPKLKLLAIYQILGGLVGIALILYLVFSLVAFDLLILAMLSIAVLLYSFSILCGILVFKDLVKGLKYSRVNQFLQILYLSIFGYGFKYLSGLFVTIEFNLVDSFTTKLAAGTSTWEIAYSNDTGEAFIGINILAIFLLVFIDKQISRVQTVHNKISLFENQTSL